jgi:hypothetical protein
VTSDNSEANNRPGVNERWLNGWKANLRNNDDWLASYLPRRERALERYAGSGSATPVPGLPDLPPLSPPEQSWELIDNDLRVYASLYAWKWERAAVEERRWDPGLAATAFWSEYLAELVSLHRFTLAPRRGIRPSQLNDIASMCFTALGIVAGHNERALGLARAQLAAYRRRYVERTVFRPISAFLTKLLADHLSLPPVTFKGDPADIQKGELPADPVMEQLFQSWRNPDIRVLGPRCLAACDIHTHQAVTSTMEVQREFGSGRWTRTPLAVLLLFKLRHLLRLERPALEHPLLNGILGRLPSDQVAGEPNETVGGVYARMKQDGFDEKEIIAGFQPA